MWLFLLLLQLLIGIAFSNQPFGIRIHQANVAKLKCESLPFRSFYEDSKCYFSVSLQVQFDQALSLCHSALIGAVMDTTPASRPVLRVLFVDPSNYHSAFTIGQSKSVLCRYDSPSTCNHDELKGIAGKCVRRLNAKLHFNEAIRTCNSLANSKLVSVNDDDENKALASFILEDESAWMDQPSFNLSGTGATEKIQYFRWLLGNGRCRANNGIHMVSSKKSQCVQFGYWQQSASFMPETVFCMRPSDGDFTPAEKKRVDQVTAPTTTTKKPCEDLPFSANMLTRMANEETATSITTTDGRFKFLSHKHIDLAIKQCGGCGAQHLRILVLSNELRNFGSLVLPPTYAQNYPNATKFGVSTVAGACGANVPLYGVTSGGLDNRKAERWLTTVRAGKSPYGLEAGSNIGYYGWPLSDVEMKQIQNSDEIATTTKIATTRTTTTATTTKKPVPPAPIMCNDNVGFPIPQNLLKRLETRPSIKINGNFKVISHELMDRAVEKCGCGAKHLQYVVLMYDSKVGGYSGSSFNSISHYKLSVPAGKFEPGSAVFGVAYIAGVCGANVPVYGGMKFDNKKLTVDFIFSTTRISGTDSVHFYAWP